MKSFSIIAALLATATLTVAAPTPSAPVSGLKYELITREEILERLATSPTDANDVLVKRTAGNVCPSPSSHPSSLMRTQAKATQIYMCTGGNWGSTCGNVWIPSDQYPTCYTIPEPWFESVGSMGPDTGALYRLTT